MLAQHTFNNCLLNLYADGDSGMGWHFDSYELLSAHSPIAIASLGAERILQFRARHDPSVRWETPMKHGEVLVMERTVQDEWLHRLPRLSGSVGPRVSLTFRAFAAQ